MVTGATRSFAVAFDEVTRVFDPLPDAHIIGLQIVIARGHTIFIADTRVNEVPDADTLADIAVQSAAYARLFGHVPRVALLSYSNFGQPMAPNTVRLLEAVEILDSRKVDFEYDGEMAADTALDPELRERLYPFCRLSGPANVLVMPALHSASIAAKLLQKIGGGSVLGPMLLGVEKPVQIVQMGATAQDLLTAAAMAAHDAIG
jgi:malate dehydrogenase (oxaloacetate-decarboxylating)(NADP+)